MRIKEAGLAEVRLIRLERHFDGRGQFIETFNPTAFRQVGIDEAFVLDAGSISVRSGTVRALHFQTPPMEQAKLVRVVHGSIFDVVVDIRDGSPTFGNHAAVRLDAGDWTWLYVPKGFAHGFCTLADETEVAYKLTGEYAPQHAAGILWNDPALGIEWPISTTEAVVSRWDMELPPLRALEAVFTYCP